MPDHFGNHEGEEFLGERGVEVGLARQFFEPRDLFGLARRVGGRQIVFAP